MRVEIKKSEKIIFMLVSIFIFIMFLFVARTILADEKNGEYEKIYGNISDIQKEKRNGDYHYKVYVTYIYKGEIYENVRIYTYTSSMSIGKEIDLEVNIHNPKDVKLAGFIGSPWFVVIITAIPMLGFSILFFAIAIKGVKITKRVSYGNANNNTINEPYNDIPKKPAPLNIPYNAPSEPSSLDMSQSATDEDSSYDEAYYSQYFGDTYNNYKE